MGNENSSSDDKTALLPVSGWPTHTNAHTRKLYYAMLVMMIANDKDNTQMDERGDGIARHGKLLNIIYIIIFH